MILLRVSSYVCVSTPFLFVHIMYTQSRELLLECTCYLSEGNELGCYRIELKYLQINNTNQKHIHHGTDFRRCCDGGQGKQKRQALRVTSGDTNE